MLAMKTLLLAPTLIASARGESAAKMGLTS